MAAELTIKHGAGDAFYWIRPEGKGNFECSPFIQKAANQKLEEGCCQVVIDLQSTRGMDSTFMGTLAGLAVRMQKSGKRLQLAGVDARNRDSLEDLGLDVLMDIEPLNASWRGHQSDIRKNLELMPIGSHAELSEHVLKSHRQLSDLSPENEKKFHTVLEILDKESK